MLPLPTPSRPRVRAGLAAVLLLLLTAALGACGGETATAPESESPAVIDVDPGSTVMSTGVALRPPYAPELEEPTRAGVLALDAADELGTVLVDTVWSAKVPNVAGSVFVTVHAGDRSIPVGWIEPDEDRIIRADLKHLGVAIYGITVQSAAGDLLGWSAVDLAEEPPLTRAPSDSFTATEAWLLGLGVALLVGIGLGWVLGARPRAAKMADRTSDAATPGARVVRVPGPAAPRDAVGDGGGAGARRGAGRDCVRLPVRTCHGQSRHLGHIRGRLGPGRWHDHARAGRVSGT